MAEKYERQRIFIAVKGVVRNGEKTLLVRRSNCLCTDGRDWWEFPGGTLEFGESPEQTLAREFFEETGLQVVPKKLLYVWSVQNDPKYQIIVITYLCGCEEISSVQLSDEHSGYMWADARQMRQMLANDIQEALDANEIWKLFDME